MAYCGVKPSCGFNRAGERVRVCKKHRHLRTTALGEVLKRAEPKREYHDQSKYYAKYRTKAWIKKKAANGSKAAQAHLKRLADKTAKGKGEGKVKNKTAKKAGPKRSVAKAETPKPAPSITKPDAKSLKAARDKRYRDKQKAQKAAAVEPGPTA